MPVFLNAPRIRDSGKNYRVQTACVIPASLLSLYSSRALPCA
jgi:hypothetical protein